MSALSEALDRAEQLGRTIEHRRAFEAMLEQLVDRALVDPQPDRLTITPLEHARLGGALELLVLLGDSSINELRRFLHPAAGESCAEICGVPVFVEPS